MTADPTRLRRTVAELLTRARGRPTTVRDVVARPSPAATLFPVDVICVTLADGAQVQMFLKRLSARQPDHPDKQRCDREVRIYEELFTDPDLPLPRCYGSRHDARAEVYELFLEYIDGDVLQNHSFTHWLTAARRLGQLHRHFAARAEAMAATTYLLRFDAPYLIQWAHRALSVVGDYSADLARQLESIVQSYHRVADPIAVQPVTLVHNDLAPKNVIVDTVTNPARICFVDWEMAGVGCGLLDLAHLKYGMNAENDRQMCAAYCSELAGTGLLPSDWGDFSQLAAACALHKNIFRLSRSRDWQVPMQTVVQWVTETHQLWNRISKDSEATRQ